MSEKQIHSILLYYITKTDSGIFIPLFLSLSLFLFLFLFPPLSFPRLQPVSFSLPSLPIFSVLLSWQIRETSQYLGLERDDRLRKDGIRKDRASQKIPKLEKRYQVPRQYNETW